MKGAFIFEIMPVFLINLIFVRYIGETVILNTLQMSIVLVICLNMYTKRR